MQILDFTAKHTEPAALIAKRNYEMEQKHVPALPPIDAVPDLTPFADNGLGVAAFEGGEMIGFLCCVSPFKNAFGSTDAVGVFSPMGANGTQLENRAEIYARMYQVAGEKWAMAGASSHAVCLYAHDTVAQEQFFRYGFGLRSIDAIRTLEEIPVSHCAEYTFAELTPDEYQKLLSLDHMLDAHMAASPTFILRASATEESFLQKLHHGNPRFFVSRKNNEIVAFIKISDEGETFITGAPDIRHICGAFCLPQYRGTGVYANLLGYLIKVLKSEGCTGLGVDFESFNPTGNGFWLKHFDAYTYGVVRRIDEHALS